MDDAGVQARCRPRASPTLTPTSRSWIRRVLGQTCSLGGDVAGQVGDEGFEAGHVRHRLDEGFFYIVDRWKDMYISGGENVYPAEVENVLYQLPEVAEAAVIGVPSDKWGEVGLAVLVLKPGHSLDKVQVLAHCAERLARFKTPHDIALLPALPRNATGKVLKRELRRQFVGADAPAIT